MRIKRNALASVVQVVASAVIMFFLYRGILTELGVELLGVWSVVLATASASRLGELGLSMSVTRFVAKHRATGNDTAAGYAVQTAAISIAVFLVLFSVLAYPMLGFLLERLFADEMVKEARVLLPFVLISLVLTVVSSVFQSGLDGCQRYDWRAFVVILGQLLFLCAALSLAPKYGLVGMAWAQIAQAISLLVIGWIVLRRVLPGLPWLPHQWSSASFREMLGYGLQYQLGFIAMMLFEPLTKILLGKYGGLSAAGYYEMASQFVTKARQLIVAANQVLVPFTAELVERDSKKLLDVYRINVRLVLMTAIPLFSVVAAYSSLLSELWIGQYEHEFVFLTAVLAVAWCLNTLSVPAYFLNLGTGLVGWNTLSYIWIGVVNLVLGLLLGPVYGMPGIAMGMLIALASGSVLIILRFHYRENLALDLFYQREVLSLIVAGCAVGIVGLCSYHVLLDSYRVVRFLICMSIPLLILGPVMWIHPMRSVILARMKGV